LPIAPSREWVEQLRPLDCTQKENERSVRKVVVQVCSWVGGEPAETITARNTLRLRWKNQCQ
jgi:hypothetical protein